MAVLKERNEKVFQYVGHLRANPVKLTYCQNSGNLMGVGAIYRTHFKKRQSGEATGEKLLACLFTSRPLLRGAPTALSIPHQEALLHPAEGTGNVMCCFKQDQLAGRFLTCHSACHFTTIPLRARWLHAYVDSSSQPGGLNKKCL